MTQKVNPSPKSLNDKVALITGAGRGIGKATATALAQTGATVVLAARSTQQLQQTAATIENSCDSKVLAVTTDLEHEESIQNLAEQIKTQLGRLDFLINNAGITLSSRLEDTTTEQLQDISADLVVLATGMQPNTAEDPIPAEVPYDDYGFVTSPTARPGIYAAGCVRAPVNVSEAVQDGTAAALKAIQSIARR